MKTFVEFLAEKYDLIDEAEQLDEVSKDLAVRAYRKAVDYSENDLDDLRDRPYGYSANQAEKFKARLSQHNPKREVPGRGEGAAKGKYRYDALNFPYRADAHETKKDGKLSKNAIKTAKWVADMKLHKLKKQPKPNLPSDLDPDTSKKVEQLMSDTQSRDHAIRKVVSTLGLSREKAERHVDHIINKSMTE